MLEGIVDCLVLLACFVVAAKIMLWLDNLDDGR